MQSRFEFLEEQIPKLAADAAQKINDLLDTKDEEYNEYNSEMACTRLLTTAKELCEWIALRHGDSKFSFLADLFLPGRFIPPLSNLAEIGREAEENLFTNTRYCLICLGDMGEAIVDYLMNTNNIETHERDQMYRIDSLFKNYVITDEIKDALHDLRMARNKAVHERYDNTYTSEEEGKRLLDEVLKMCEWLFKLILKPGYIVKGKISEINENSISVLIGSIPAVVPSDEIPSNENSYIKGKKYIFKVIEKTSEKITLSLKQADEDYNLNIVEKYSKYKIGQDVRVIIKRISNSSGALVELKDGLLAQIPPSEIGRRLYDYDDANNKQIKYEVTARVKWFSQTQYPPMLLSVRDIEREDKAEAERLAAPKWEQAKPKKNTMRDLNFRTFVKNAPFEKILEALDSGANPNAKNHNKTTALMTAAQYNQDPKAIEALLDAGAELEARNHKGNTALHFAAMGNIPAVVKFLVQKGADIEALNHDKKTPLDYARSNKNLNGTEIIKLLTPAQEKQDNQESDINFRLLNLCKSGTVQEVSDLIDSGADVNTISRNKTTPLMTAAQYNSIETVELLLNHHADVNAKNKMGNTALHFAAAYNTYEVVCALVNAGAAVGTVNEKGKTPLDSAEENIRLKDTDAVALLGKREINFKKDFLRICRSGSVEEISQAVNAGANINSKNKALSTALMFAARDNTADAVNILIEAGAYLDAQDIYGNTALIYAAYHNNEDVVDVLINAGSDIALSNTSGYTAYDYAKQNYRLADTETLNRLGSRD